MCIRDRYNGIYQELNIFVPKEDTVKINILNLKNLHAKKRKLKLLYYIKDVLGEDEIKTGMYTIKDMANGTQEQMEIEKIIEKLK